MAKEIIGPREMLAMLRATAAAWQDSRAETDALDAALGDGDHGSGLATGLGKAVANLHEAQAISEMLLHTATGVMNQMGGAAGALFGSFFLAMATACRGESSLNPAQFAAACAAGLSGLQRRSRAALGDKTMLDALIPAITTLQESVDAGDRLTTALENAASAAQAGAEATIPLAARHGRARFLGERARGTMDAGARSMAILFAAWQNALSFPTIDEE